MLLENGEAVRYCAAYIDLNYPAWQALQVDFVSLAIASRRSSRCEQGFVRIQKTTAGAAMRRRWLGTRCRERDWRGLGVGNDGRMSWRESIGSFCSVEAKRMREAKQATVAM